MEIVTHWAVPAITPDDSSASAHMYWIASLGMLSSPGACSRAGQRYHIKTFIIPSEERQSRPDWSYSGPNSLLTKWLCNTCDETLVSPCRALSDSFDPMNHPLKEIPYPLYGGSPDCSSSSSL